MSSSPQPADASSQQQRQLPTPRQLLTAILDAIGEIPPGPSPSPHSHPFSHPTAATGLNGSITTTATIAAANKSSSSSSTATNPLAHIPPSARHLFTTLHVLFPSLLLPALDLLDRGLVTRLAVEQQQPQLQLEQAISHIYLVRSAQKVSSNPYHHHHHNNNDSLPGLGPGPGQAYSDTHSINNNPRLYAVHTLVWNCTCAAFAFSAFPAVLSAGDSGNITTTLTKKQKEQEQQQPGAQSTETSPSRRRQHRFNDIRTKKQTTNFPGCADRRDDHDHDDADDGEEINLPDSRDFGGLSFNGTEQYGNNGRSHTSSTGNASVPPCCKHLLACVLAERWDAVLGRYVNRRTVQREEMAGIFADV